MGSRYLLCPFYKPQSDQNLSYTCCSFPQTLGPGWASHRGGDSDLKAKFGFFSFFFFLSFFNDDYFYCDLTTCFNDTCSLFCNTFGTRNKVHQGSLFGCCGLCSSFLSCFDSLIQTALCSGFSSFFVFPLGKGEWGEDNPTFLAVCFVFFDT